MTSWPFAGALMRTFFAPAVRCAVGLLLVGEEAGALEHDVDAELLPRELARVLLGEDLRIACPPKSMRALDARVARCSARPWTVS